MVKVIKPKLKNSSLFIYQNNSNKFDNVFSDFLREDLLKDNVTINLDPKLANEYLSYNVKIVKLNKNLSSLRNMQGVPTLIASGVWFVNKYATHIAIVAGVTTAEGLIWYNSKKAKGDVPNYEVSVTINVYNKNKYITTVNKIYYVSDLDYNLYSNYNNKKIVFKIEGGI